jgi:hypothetical protein
LAAKLQVSPVAIVRKLLFYAATAGRRHLMHVFLNIFTRLFVMECSFNGSRTPAFSSFFWIPAAGMLLGTGCVAHMSGSKFIWPLVYWLIRSDTNNPINELTS